jgi:hypothetical protein
MSKRDGRELWGNGAAVRYLYNPYSCSTPSQDLIIMQKAFLTSSFVVFDTFTSDDAEDKYAAASDSAGDGVYFMMVEAR